jgi:hypothetical protein
VETIHGQPNGFFVYVDHNDNLLNSCNLLFWVEKVASLVDTIYPEKNHHLQWILVLLVPY